MAREGEGGDELPRTLGELDSAFQKVDGAALSTVGDLREDLETACEETLARLKLDRETIGGLLEDSGLSIRMEDFQDPGHVIRWGFPLRGESLEADAEWLRYNLAHLRMAEDVLDGKLIRLVRKRLDAVFRRIEDLDWPLSWDNVDGLQGAFEELDILAALCSNVRSIGDRYEQAYGHARDLMDPEFEYEPPRTATAHIYSHEFHDAARTLLLSRESGRHALAPLIRTENEVAATRLIRKPPDGSEYKDKAIVATKGLSAERIADVAGHLDVPVQFGPDALKQVYDWGSISTHFGYRYPHDELWYAHLYARALRNGLVQGTEAEAVEYYDQMIAKLEEWGAVKIEEPTEQQETDGD